MGKNGVKEGLLSQYLVYWNHVKEAFNLMTHAYQVMPAVTPDLKAEAFRVRHKVYCAELNYEAENTSGMEEDEFDHHSTQMVLYSRAHKSYIGCVRLVHGRHEGGHHELPFEHHCRGRVNNKIFAMVKESGHHYAEVSRLAIEKNFRHVGRDKTNQALGGQTKSSFALLSLYLGLHAMARQQGVRYLFAIVEPRLLRNLHRHNVPAIQIGQGVDHRGLRVPVLIDVEDIEKIIPSAIRPIYGALCHDVSKLLRPVERAGKEDLPSLPLREILTEQEKLVGTAAH